MQRKCKSFLINCFRQTIKTKELVKDIVVNLPSDEELQDASPTDILLNADLIKITEGGVEVRSNDSSSIAPVV